MGTRPQNHELAEIARRIKAARLLQSTDESIRQTNLAGKFKEYGLKPAHLHRLERARQEAEPLIPTKAELDALEDAFKIPRRWFTAPLDDLFRLEGPKDAKLPGVESDPESPSQPLDSEETDADSQNGEAVEGGRT